MHPCQGQGRTVLSVSLRQRQGRQMSAVTMKSPHTQPYGLSEQGRGRIRGSESGSHVLRGLCDGDSSLTALSPAPWWW